MLYFGIESILNRQGLTDSTELLFQLTKAYPQEIQLDNACQTMTLTYNRSLLKAANYNKVKGH
jgi:hypothetical protein